MSLREAMPQTAAFIDALREAFGREDIDAQIRAGMSGVPGRFYARENGHEVGTPSVDDGVCISVSQMYLEKPRKDASGGRR